MNKASKSMRTLRQLVLKFIILLTILSLLLPAGGLLFPRQASADGITYPHSFAPPYVDAETWTHTTKLSPFCSAKAEANPSTGFIAAHAYAFCGGALAEATQCLDIDIPDGLFCKVYVDATIIYTGGTEKEGASYAAYGGSDKIWYIGGSDAHRTVLDPAFGLDDIGAAALDVAIAVLGASEIEGIDTVIDTVNAVQTTADILEGFGVLETEEKAHRTHIIFNFEASSPTRVKVGFKVFASGTQDGICDVALLGVVESINVNVVPRENEGFWRFSSFPGGGEGEVIYDVSGNNHDGITHNGPTSTSGKSGNGIRFDGVDDWAELDFAAVERENLARGGTLMLWVKPEERRDAMLIYGGSGGSADGWGPDKELHLCTESTGAFTFYMGSYADNYRYMQAYIGWYEPNQWYHIAVTYFNHSYGCEVQVYFNGHLVREEVVTSSGDDSVWANLSLDDIRLGRPNAGRRYFKGVMDEVRVYGCQLSEEEIAADCWAGIDMTPPSTPVMIAEPDYSPGDTNMVACEPSTDIKSGVAAYQFRCRLRGGASWEESPWIGSPNYIFGSLADCNLYDYRVRAKDWAGNESGWSASVSSKQDASPPEVTTLWLGPFISGQVQGNKLLVDFDFGATDYAGDVPSGIAWYQLSYDGESWQTYELSEPYHSHFGTGVQLEIPLIQGSRTFWAKAIDAVGNESAAYSGTTIVDYEPPSGTITINSGDEFTNSRQVTLSLNVSDNLCPSSSLFMHFSNDGVTWSGYEQYDATKDNWWLCTEELDYGEKTVYAQFKDLAGNISPACCDTISYGPVPTGEIIIDNNAVWTGNYSPVILSLLATNVTEMAIWNDDPAYTPNEYDWQPYVSSKQWRLSVGDGEKTVYVKYRGTGGETQAYDSINQDNTYPTGSMLTNGVGSALSGSREVTLSLSASDNYSGVAWMRFQNDGGSWTPWESYQETRSWLLTPGEGEKGIAVQFKDRAGNQSNTYRNGVWLDVCPPAGWVEINGGDDFTNSDVVTLDAHVEGEGYSMPEQFSSTQGDISWYYYRSTAPGDYTELCWDNWLSPWGEMDHYSWNAQVGPDNPRYLHVTSLEETAALIPGEGSNVAIGWEQDKRGAVAIKGELWAAAADGGSPGGNDDGVYFSIYHNDDLIAGPVHVFHNADLHHGTLEVTLEGPPDPWVDAGDMIYFYIDRGNWQDCDAMYYNFSIISDTEHGGPSSVRFANLTPENIDCLILSQIRDGSSLLWYKALKDVAWTDWRSPHHQEAAWLLSPGDGTKTVMAQFKDYFGNISRPHIASITLDQTSPTGYGCNTPADGATNISVTPTLTSTVANDNTPPIYYKFRIANNIEFAPVLEESDWQTGTSWIPSTTLDCSTDYWWQVKAKDSISPHEGDWSTAFNKFTTEQELSYYTLTVTCSPIGDGDIKVNGATAGSYPRSYNFAHGTFVNLEAVTAAGYDFSNWFGDLSGDTNPISIIMDSDKNVTANFVEFNAPDNVDLTEADLGVDSITVTPISLGEVDTSNMTEGLDPQSAYIVESTGTGSFTLRFTDVPNAGDIEVYKIVDTIWISIPTTVIDATTIEFTMSVGDPVIVFALPSSALPSPAVGGTVYPPNKLAILVPWIVLAMAIIAGSLIAIRRRETQS